LILIFNTDTIFSLIASASDGSHSFAEAFFVSRRSDGSIEYLGSGVTWLLLAMSVGATCMMIYMFLANRKPSVVPIDLIDEIEKRIAKKDFRSIIDLTSEDQTYLGKILHAAFREARFGFPAMMRALEQTADELATARLRRIEMLNVVGQVSPMIGLFGTVYGMILAFGAIVASGGSADPVALAGGIGTALTTTFWGLVVAIPALSGYAVLRNKIDELTVEATIVAEEVLNYFRPRKTPVTNSNGSAPDNAPRQVAKAAPT
jgi:biopolymer transport protein ExbB